jgi:hypothetical protein
LKTGFLTEINILPEVSCYKKLQTNPIVLSVARARLPPAELAREAIQQDAYIKTIKLGSVVQHLFWMGEIFGVLNEGENHG